MPAILSAALLVVTEEAGLTTARFARPTSLTEEKAAAVAAEFAALVEGLVRPDVTLDLGAVEFLASMGLTMLIRLDGAVRAAGGRLTLVNPPPCVREVLAVTRLDRVLRVAAAPGAPSP
jgi:anti-anti-sigma factor